MSNLAKSVFWLKVVAMLSKVLGFIPEAISLWGSVGVVAIVYALLVKVFKVGAIDMLIDMIKKK